VDLVEITRGASGERHPWERARYAFFRDLLRRHRLPRPGTRVLDVGAGDAWLAGRLAAETGVDVTCWDTAYGDAVALAPPAGVRLTSVAPSGRFELILALDVLEHVEDDRAFLRGLAADHLAPGGALLLSVPAWPSLFSAHDRMLRHHRRYAPAGARAVLRDAGLEVDEGGGLFHGLLAVRAVQKLAERWSPPPSGGVGDWRAPRAVGSLLTGMLRGEASVSAALARLGWEVPGLSWWGLCRCR
jgi:hypothetical protein